MISFDEQQSITFDDSDISSRGYILSFCKRARFFDRRLAAAFYRLYQGQSVVDLGCGNCGFIKYLRHKGIECEGYDGNPHTNRYDERCHVLDLSEPVDLGRKFDWVMTLETGEHIPKPFEQNFIENIHNHNTKGVVMSWAYPGMGGTQHHNERPQEYLKGIFKDLGYFNDEYYERVLRRHARIPWYKSNIIVFTREEMKHFL